MNYTKPFIDPSLVSPEAVMKFFRACEEVGGEVHAFVMYRDNKLALRGAFAPYDVEKSKLEIYSASKSFTSTAIGFAVAEGLITVDDKLVDIFPDKLPPEPSEYLKMLTVKHLLTMNVGHEVEADVFSPSVADPVKVFLAHPIKFEPGTHFMYNTAATGVLSSIICKKTGKSLVDYLTPRLFVPLGINDVSWRTLRNGASFGGFGLHASCDDMSKLGLLYLNEGIYGDRRLLSADWVREASTGWSDNAATGGVRDWGSGYGYQLWRCERGGYRADGAFGQYIVIRNDKNVVFALQTESKDMQKVLDKIQDLIESMDMPGMATAETVYEHIAAGLPCLPDPSKKKLPKNFPGTYYTTRNAAGVTMFSYERTDDGKLVLTLSDSVNMQKIVCGEGEWVESDMCIPMFGYYLLKKIGSLPYKVAACYMIEAGKLIIKLRLLDRPHSAKLVCTASAVGSRIVIENSIDASPLAKLNGKRA